MAKVRPARPCSAKRTSGAPCRAYAMLGGRTCRSHGGAARQAREAARRQRAVETLERAVARAEALWQRRYGRWQARRVAAAAELLGVEPAEVTPALLGAASVLWPGKVPGLDQAPRVGPLDRRFGIRPRIVTKPRDGSARSRGSAR